MNTCSNFIEDAVCLCPAFLAPLTRKHSFIQIVLLLLISKCVTVWEQEIACLSEIRKLEVQVSVFLSLPHSVLSCFLQTSPEAAVQTVFPLVFS